jgi:hypothetical protein
MEHRQLQEKAILFSCSKINKTVYLLKRFHFAQAINKPTIAKLCDKVNQIYNAILYDT